jgi:hypothetical protein
MLVASGPKLDQQQCGVIHDHDVTGLARPVCKESDILWVKLAGFDCLPLYGGPEAIP